MEIKVKSTTLKKDLCVIMSVVLILPQLLLCGGSLANGIHTFGNYVLSGGNVTEGNVTDSDITPGDITPGDITPGDITPGDITPGDITPGDITPGDITPGDITPGDITPGNISCGNITPGEIKWISITPGNVSLLEFIPSETGNYVFTSHSEYGDTYGFLYDANMYCLAYDDDSGVGNNFKIQYTLRAGETYYFGARFYNKNIGGSFNVSLDTYEYSPFTFTLNEDGNSYTFSRCDQSYSGEVVIPATYKGKPVTSIGDSAFEWCGSLTSVTIPDSVTSIDAYTFAWCSSLTSIEIPDSVTSIDWGAFYGCESIASVTIPDSVTSIGYGAFCNCSSLTSVTIPDSVTSIGNRAFWGCSSLASVTIGNSVTSIGEYAFYNCSSLTSVTIPDSVTSIGDYAFGYVGDMEPELSAGFIIHSHINTAAEAYAKANGIIWEDLCKHIHTENRAAVAAQSCSQPGYTAGVFCLDCDNWLSGHENVFIPHTDEDCNYICDSCSGWVCDIIPDEIKEITVGAGETKLLKFTPYVTETYSFTSESDSYIDTFGYLYDADMNVLTSDDDSAGNGNFKVKYTLEAGETYYFGARFLYENRSGSFNVSLTVSSPFTFTLNEDGNSYTFAKCEQSYSGEVVIPSTYNGKPVTGIGGYAFEWCNGISCVTVPDSVTSIAEGAFYNCSSLTSLTIPDSVTSIGDNAFCECSGLESVNIPDSVTSIGENAFYECSSLISIEIPDSVTSIGYFAFSGCSSLTSINVVADNKYYSSKDGVLFNKDKTELICCPAGKTGAYVVPNSVTNMSDRAFYNCCGLTSIKIPASVTSIGYESFYCCSSLISIEIPDSVTSIGDFAFHGCSSLASIEIPDAVTSIGGYAFSDCSSLTTVEIPDGVTNIGSWAFRYCSGITSITIPNSVTRIGGEVFFGCKDDLVIYGFSDSYAESYAGENSITFKAVDILPKGFARVDYANKCIFSEKSIKSLDDCLICDTNIALECVKSGFGVIGTGALVNVKSGDAVIDTYTMIISGDLDGDGVSDVLDAVLAERALHGRAELSAAQAYAANNSADTEIDAQSYQNVVNRALGA